MAQFELYSFYVKFKNLLLSEQDATLTLKSESGRAVISLCVDLGHVLSRPDPPKQPRNGPSRQRRREKRAAVRKLAVEKTKADAEEAPEKVLTINTTEEEAKDTFQEKAEQAFLNHFEINAEEALAIATVETAEEAIATSKVPKDEFCNDETYQKPAETNSTNGMSATSTPASSSNAATRPSTSFRGLGGVDYYTLTYDDPSDSD